MHASVPLVRCREVVDSKCYSLSYEFLCQLLQPVCFDAKVVLPCHAFCQEFMQSCGHILPADLRGRVRCEAMPTEAKGHEACISKPGAKVFFWHHLKQKLFRAFENSFFEIGSERNDPEL